jgi:phosphoglycolate phosphatase-like HAD superfamily hydrolase
LNKRRVLLRKPKIETIIWDLDGTIFNSFDLFCSSLEEVGPRHGFIVPSRDYIKHHYHGGLHESIIEIFGEQSKAKVDALVRDFIDHQQDGHINPDNEIYPDAKHLIEKAAQKQIIQIIVTNRMNTLRKDSPGHIIANSSLNGKFTQIVCRDEGEYNKPDARVMDLVPHAYNPKTTVVIGDQFVDAQLALNLGVSAILVARGGETIPHLERLGEGWQNHVTVVNTLDEVEL